MRAAVVHRFSRTGRASAGFSWRSVRGLPLLLLMMSAVAQGQSCGLAQAAFCETFESGPAAAGDRGRGHELSRTRFSTSRYAPSLMGDGDTFWARAAELGMLTGEIASCRSNITGYLLPDRDTLVCDPNAQIGSRYLLTAVGSQNYGVNTYRIRQPFDFAGRTGRIVFDNDLDSNFLLGYSSLVISDEPAQAPSWDLNARGPNPRNGLLLVFNGSNVEVYDVRNYATTTIAGSASSPLPHQRGRLCRVEVRLSQQQLEVLSSEPSADGIVFGPLQSRRVVNFAQPLTYSRGHVALLAHNHATWKYGITYGGLPRPLRSWNTYWDNIGFDGPVIQQTREYEIPAANVPMSITTIDEHPAGVFTTVVHQGLNQGYRIPDGPSALSAPLVFTGVSLDHAVRARLVFNGYYQGHNVDGIRSGTGRLRYRLNDHPPHLRAFTAAEVAMLNEPGQTWGFNHVIDLPLDELVDGDNSVRFGTFDITSGYPNSVTNLDLLIDFDIGLIFANGFD